MYRREKHGRSQHRKLSTRRNHRGKTIEAKSVRRNSLRLIFQGQYAYGYNEPTDQAGSIFAGR
jgi:hypothetical protein